MPGRKAGPCRGSTRSEAVCFVLFFTHFIDWAHGVCEFIARTTRVSPAMQTWAPNWRCNMNSALCGWQRRPRSSEASRPTERPGEFTERNVSRCTASVFIPYRVLMK